MSFNEKPGEINKIKLDGKRINKYHFTLSLLQEAHHLSLINRQEIFHIQQQVMAVLKSLISKYTGGISSSVRVETAESMQRSLLYTLDVFLAEQSDPETSLALLKESPVREIYQQGRELLKEIFYDTETLYSLVKRDILDIPLQVYRSSIEDALPEFFRNYDPEFKAHDTMTMLDYPLVLDDMKLEGVLYIKNYLQNLQTETRFCRIFNRKDIISILKDYGQVYQIDYRQYPINIFEVLLTNSIFTALLDNKPGCLRISEEQIAFLQEELLDSSPAEINKLLHRSLGRLIKQYKINNQLLMNYLNRCKKQLFPRMINSAANNSLNSLLITTKSQSPAKAPVRQISLTSGSRLTDERFRLMVDKIKVLSTAEDKITLIKTTIYSQEDFIELLEAGCLFAGEFAALYSALTTPELAVLVKNVFMEELRCDTLDLSSSSLEKKAAAGVEAEWIGYLLDYLGRLAPEQRQAVIEKIQLLESGDV